MIKFYNYIKSALILVFLLGAGSLFNLANAQVTNGGFESGTTGWTGIGFSTSTGETILNWNVQPADSKMGRVSPGSGSVTASTAQSALGLSTQLTSITKITNVGYVYQDITMSAGQTITIYWNYVSQDYEPWDDGTFASFTKSGDVQFKILARTWGASDVGVANTGAYGSTGWHTVSFTAASAGTYRLGFGAFNWSDQSVHPILYIDNASGGTSSPQQPIVSTTTPSSITNNSGVVGGSVTSAGTGSVSDRGIVYSSSNSTPVIGDGTKVAVGSGLGTYSTTLTGLSNGTTYYIRAYATSDGGTSYGGVKQLTTLSMSPPTVSTGSVSDVDHNSATGSVSVSADGGATITEYGIVYGTSSNPTTSNSKNLTSAAPSLNTTYNFGMALTANTTYYVRGYAINSAGTSYGSQISFKTASAPPVATAATLVGESSFTMNWNASTGAIKYYLDVSTASDFSSFVTDFNNKDVGNVTNYKITGLTPGTNYYYRLRAYNGDAISGNSNSITVTTKILDNFLVEAYGGGSIQTQTAGQPFNIRLTARDADNNRIIDYVGTATITSNGNLYDGTTGIESVTTSSFTGGVFSSQSVILTLTGVDIIITATAGDKSGTSNVFTVMPGPINNFTIVANPDGNGDQQAVMAGVPFNVLVKVFDEFGNLKTDYDGANPVVWTTTATPSRKGNVYEIPVDGNQTFIEGVATISGFTLYDAEETPTITITDGPTSSPGTTSAIEVLPNVLYNFTVEEYPKQTHLIGGVRETSGIPFGIKVTARDVYQNIKRDYEGFINFKSSNDAIVNFPDELQQFTLADNGYRIFTNDFVIPKTGAYWLYVADSPYASEYGQLQNIIVGPGTYSTSGSELASTTETAGLTAGDYVGILITPRDADGNLLCDCQSVSIFLNGEEYDWDSDPNPIPYKDNHDGTYSASVRVTELGSNTITASVDGSVMSDAIDVTIDYPAAPSLVVSTVTPNSASITTNENTEILLQLKDEFGNNRTTDDGTITFTTDLGGFGANNGSQTVEATYVGGSTGQYTAFLYASYDAVNNGVGTATVSASADFTDANHTDGNFSDTAPVEITEGLPDLTTSTIVASDDEITTDETSLITIQLKDHLGNLIQNDRGEISLYTDLGALGSSEGGLNIITSYAGSGAYVATLYGTLDLPVNGVGTANLTANFVGEGTALALSGYLNDGAATPSNTVEQVIIYEGLPDVTTIDISVADASITADDSTVITVQLKDQFGNLVINNRGTVTLSVTPIGIVDNGVTTGSSDITAIYQSAGAYTAKFKLNAAGVGTATITGKFDDSAITDNAQVEVLHGVATQLAVETQPAHLTTEAIAGVVFSTQPQVSVQDQWGNIVTADDTTTIYAATGSVGSGNLLGTLSATVSNGVASFSGLNYQIAEDMNIAFTSGDLTGVTSDNLAVVHNVPDYMEITGSATQTAGVSQTITIKVYDEYGNPAIRFDGSKPLMFAGANVSPAPPYNPTMDGTAFGTSTNLVFADGVATGSMILYKEETAYIEADHIDAAYTDSYTGATNLTIAAGSQNGLEVEVSQADSYYLAITGNATQEAGTSQTITITAYDEFNNVATNYTGTKQIRFGGASASDAPSTNPNVDVVDFGTNTDIDFSSGVATASLSLFKVEDAVVTATDYTSGSAGITTPDNVTSGEVTYVYKLPVEVTPAAANYFAVTGNGTQTAGESQSITVTAYDSWNNKATGYQGSKDVTFSGASDSPDSPKAAVSPTVSNNGEPSVDIDFGSVTSMTFTEGVATGSMVLTKVETAEVKATEGLITTSDDYDLEVVVSHAANNYFAVTGSATQVAGVAQNITVTMYDAFNNIATSYDGDMSLTFSGASASEDGDIPVIGTTNFGDATTVSFVNGIASNVAMTLFDAANPTSDALVDVNNGTQTATGLELLVNVTPNDATQLRIDTEPSSYVRAGDALAQQPVISIRDAYGNVTTADDTTLVIASINTGTDELVGTDTITVTVGVANFTNLSYEVMEAISINFDASVLATVTSQNITVDHNATDYYTYTASPAYIYAGGQRGKFTVKRYDAYDNEVDNLVLGNGSDSPDPEVVYLYSDSPDVSSTFFNVASGGTALDTIRITNGNTTKDFWYYSQDEGTHRISASDNATSADGDAGINDADYDLEVKPAALDHFVVSGVGTDVGDGWTEHYYGDRQSVTVEAIDMYGNRKINYTGTITFSLTDDEANEPGDAGNNYPVDYTFAEADSGIHTFTNAILFERPSYEHPNYPTVDEWWVTVIDQNDPMKRGAQIQIKVLARPITITAHNQTKQYYGDSYDLGSTEFTVTSGITGYENPSVYAGVEQITGVTLTSTGTATTALAGDHAIIPENATGINEFNPDYYDITYTNGTLTVEQRPITITVDASQSKIYGEPDPTGSDYTLSSGTIASWDSFSGNLTRESGEDIGLYDVYFTGLSIVEGETDKTANYDITFENENQFEITKRLLTLSNFVAGDKTYDGTTDVISGADFDDDRVAGDELTFGYDVAFADKHAGIGKTVNYSNITIGGTAAANYTLAGTSGTATADIAQRDINVTAVTDTKVYDGTTSSDKTPIVDALQAGDVVTYAGIQVYDNKNQGTGKTLTASGTVIDDGNSGDNYSVTYVADNTGIITKRELIGSFTADNKVYDGTTEATVLTRTLSNVISGEESIVSLTGGTAAFDTKHVGTGKTITLTGATIAGDGVDNYTLTSVNTATADISVRSINVTAVADTKTYDGLTTSDETPIVDALQTGDAVTDAGIQTYDNKNVGVGKTVTPGATVINDGNSGANYSITYVDNTTSEITSLDIAGTFTANDKVYDGDVDAIVLTQSLIGVLVADQAEVSLSGGSASFSDRHVGDGKTVTASGMTLSGAEAGNYNLTSVAITTANITPLAITGNFTVEASKEYDGNTLATVTGRTLNNIQNVNDEVSLTDGIANYDDKNVGVGKIVTLTGYNLSGAQSGNYTLTSVGTTTADITVRVLHLTNFAADNKEYDGNTTATGLGFDDDRVPGDNLSFQRDADFEDAAVGTNKVVVYNTVIISGGADMNNYVLESERSHWKTGPNRIISPAPITVTIVAEDKEYDGNTDATVTLSGNFLDGDDVDLDYASAQFEDAEIGDDKNVTVTGIALTGSDAGQYTLASTSGTTTASIVSLQATQTLNLNTGWNIISIGVTPDGSRKLMDVLKSLIDNETLLKVMDERGRTIENLGNDFWYEGIGDLLFTEGYQVKVKENTSISIQGKSVELPIDISLVQGWNLISFPALSEQSAMEVLQDLIDGGYLLKAMDEKGRSVENLNGSWYNFIGNFESGKGYKVKVAEACTLTIRDDAPKSSVIVPELLSAAEYSPIFNGNGYDHMNIVLTGLYESGLKPGDQIGIFDGERCVGALTIDDRSYLNDMISIPVSSNDGMSAEPNGYITGNEFSIKAVLNNKELDVDFDVLSGPGSFKVGATSIVALSTQLEITEDDRISNAYGVKMYPNPFTTQMVIEIVQPEGEELNIDIYDIQGRKVRTIDYGMSTGHDQVRWNGRNQSGDEVKPGIYYIRVNGYFKGNVIKQ